MRPAKRDRQRKTKLSVPTRKRLRPKLKTRSPSWQRRNERRHP